MAQLKSKAVGDSRFLRKRVYFACYPEDHGDYFQKIAEELLRYDDCVIYYYDEEPEQDEEYFENLDRMQLMVIPVTNRLLCLPNRAMDVELPYALEHHIPVLPLMQEPGLEKKYAERFGNLQYLDKGNRDVTAIPYEEKLKKCLKAVYINSNYRDYIRDEFVAWIFLSYRKKDRKAAQKLMRLIHSDPRCQDIAIWYDEFLNPGEDFNDAIRKALAESQLFVLAVTPNLLEQGNYVMQEEYPEAKKSGKPILPAEMEQTDRDALKNSFDGLPDPVDPGKDGAVSQAILDALGSLPVRKTDDPAGHMYLIGKAYLTGSYVEKDHDRGFRLITESAEMGNMGAMNQLISMYELGNGVARDYHIAIAWREKYVEHTRQNAAIYDHYNMGFLCHLCELGDAYERVGDTVRAKMAYLECCEYAESWSGKFNHESLLFDLRECYRRLAGLYQNENDDDNAIRYFRLAIEVGRKALQIMESKKTEVSEKYERFRRHADCYDRLGELYYNKEDLAQARTCFLRGLEIRERLQRFNDRYPEYTEHDRYGLQYDFVESYLWLGKLSMKEEKPEDAASYIQRSVEINRKLVADGNIHVKPRLMDDYRMLVDICVTQDDYASANQWRLKALEIVEQQQAEETSELVMRYCEMADICEKLGDSTELKQWCEKALELAEKMAQMGSDEDYEILAGVYGMIGEWNRDVSMLKKAVDTFRWLAAKHPGDEQYTATISFAEELIHEINSET